MKKVEIADFDDDEELDMVQLKRTIVEVSPPGCGSETWFRSFCQKKRCVMR